MRIDLKLDKDGRSELAGAIRAALVTERSDPNGAILLIQLARCRSVGLGPQLRIAGDLVGRLAFWFGPGSGRLADAADVVDGAPSDHVTLLAVVVPTSIYWELHPKWSL